ncbi:MAG: hypothetical protein LBI34_02165 [Puniceicoccales bacterium]|jgi:hypothetical protein|nr:hypothetical protein [Puniceicoccales bacterium]
MMNVFETARKMYDDKVAQCGCAPVFDVTDAIASVKKLAAVAQPEDAASAIDLIRTVQPVSQEIFFSKYRSVIRFIHQFREHDIMRKSGTAINAFLACNLPGIFLCGCGRLCAYLRVLFPPDVGIRVIREIHARQIESRNFLEAMFAHAFEPESQWCPKAAERTLAAAEIGKMFARLGCESPTIDAEIWTNPGSGTSYISMTNAGDQPLEEWFTSHPNVTGELIDRFALLQAFLYIIGQCDGHAGNFLVDSRTGRIAAIDFETAFPPFQFGRYRFELIDNIVECLHAYDTEWGRYSFDRIRREIFPNDASIDQCIILAPPPVMAQQTYDICLGMTSSAAVDGIDEILARKGCTANERAATKCRLKILREQLESVRTVNDVEELRILWHDANSPFTRNNCWLRRFPK